MKTFIYTTDTEVLIANAESEREAKTLIEYKFKQDAKAFIEGDHNEKVRKAREEYVESRRVNMYEALDLQPYIVEMDQALIFTHTDLF